MSAMTDTKDRQEGLDDDTGKKVGKGVDFVDYFTAGVSLLRQEGQPDQGIKSLDDLCGKKVAVQRGTIYEDLAKDQAEKCKTDGKSELTIEAFDTDAEAQTRVKRRRRRRRSSTTTRSPRTSRRPPAAATTSRSSASRSRPAPYGIAVAKDNTELRDALQGRPGRDHRERRVREDPGEVGRRGRRRHRGHRSTAASDPGRPPRLRH